MSRGKGDMRGKRVSKDEILNELGHPGTWGAERRKMEFQKRLRRGEKKLPLSGIIGYPGHKGYLKFLYEQLKAPFGSNAGLVSKAESKKIAEKERKLIRIEIDEILKQFKKYWQLAEKIREYVVDLERALEMNKLSIDCLGPEGVYDEVEKSDEELRLSIDEKRKRVRFEREQIIKAISFWKRRLNSLSKPQ